MPPAYFEKHEQHYPASDMSALRVFLALRTVARRVDNVVGGWLDRSGMTVTKLDVLHLLAASSPGAITIGRLREFLRMTQPNVTYVVQSLEAERLVKRSPDPGDRRSSLVAITRAGLARIDALTPPHLAAIGAALEGLSDQERGQLLETLAKVADGFDGAGPPQTVDRKAVDT